MQAPKKTADAPLRVGLSASILDKDARRPTYKTKVLSFGEAGFSAIIARAGGLPFLLPALCYPQVTQDGTAARTLRAMVAELDALILTGGADLSPETYGESALRPEWAGDLTRDRYERILVDAALELGTPLLGVCRGHQFINVALGGQHYQDLVSQRPGEVDHRGEAYDEHVHPVRVAPGSWLHRIYGGAERLIVNSVHHQGVRELAPGLRPTAWADDGLIEGFEASDGRLLYGVQWHPEWLSDDRPRSRERSRGQTLFEAFFADVRAAR